MRPELAEAALNCMVLTLVTALKRVCVPSKAGLALPRVLSAWTTLQHQKGFVLVLWSVIFIAGTRDLRKAT